MHGDEAGAELLEDVTVLGVDVEALRRGPIPEQLAALIGTPFLRTRHSG